MRLLNYIHEAQSRRYTAIMDAVVVYAKRTFGIPNADVTLKHRKSTAKTYGSIMLSEKPKKKHVVYVDLTRGYRVLIGDILHEMTHIKQVIKKELTLDGDDIKWKGKTVSTKKDYTNVTYDSHGKLPFEKEANDNKKKVDEFLSSKEADALRSSGDKNVKMVMEYL